MKKTYEIVSNSTVNEHSREDWHTYFMKMAIQAAKRSTCDRANVGCLIVNERHRVVATGYNGSVGKSQHCDDIGHTMRDNHCIATVHAEINALMDCCYEGKSTQDCIAYVTHFPCINCTKALIQAGIKEIYYDNDYRIDDYAIHLLEVNGIKYEKVELDN